MSEACPLCAAAPDDEHAEGCPKWKTAALVLADQYCPDGVMDAWGRYYRLAHHALRYRREARS